MVSSSSINCPHIIVRRVEHAGCLHKSLLFMKNCLFHSTWLWMGLPDSPVVGNPPFQCRVWVPSLVGALRIHMYNQNSKIFLKRQNPGVLGLVSFGISPFPGFKDYHVTWPGQSLLIICLYPGGILEHRISQNPA